MNYCTVTSAGSESPCPPAPSEYGCGKNNNNNVRQNENFSLPPWGRCPNPFPTIGSMAVLLSMVIITSNLSSTDYQQRPKFAEHRPGNWGEIALLCTTVVVPSSRVSQVQLFFTPHSHSSQYVEFDTNHQPPAIPYNGLLCALYVCVQDVGRHSKPILSL